MHFLEAREKNVAHNLKYDKIIENYVLHDLVIMV